MYRRRAGQCCQLAAVEASPGRLAPRLYCSSSSSSTSCTSSTSSSTGSSSHEQLFKVLRAQNRTLLPWCRSCSCCWCTDGYAGASWIIYRPAHRLSMCRVPTCSQGQLRCAGSLPHTAMLRTGRRWLGRLQRHRQRHQWRLQRVQPRDNASHRRGCCCRWLWGATRALRGRPPPMWWKRGARGWGVRGRGCGRKRQIGA